MKMRKLSSRDLVMIGLLAAICTISTTIKIPYGNGAMVHLGSAAIYTTALIFGRTYAGFAGAIGSAFFDILMGFSPYTLWSFVIKGIAGFIVGGVSHAGHAVGKKLPQNVFAILCGAAWTLGGYIIAWSFVIGSFEAALLNIPSSLVSSGVGMAVALPLSYTLRVGLEKAGLLKRTSPQAE